MPFFHCDTQKISKSKTGDSKAACKQGIDNYDN